MRFGRPGGLDEHLKNQGADLANCDFLAVDNKAENRDLANLSPLSENENPGALAGATGAISSDLAISPASYRKPDGSAMSRHAKPSHKAMARSLGYALTLGDRQAWATFCLTAYRKLTAHERAALAYAALMSLDEDEAQLVAEAALETFRPDDPPTQAFVEAAAGYRRARDRRAA